MAHRRGISRGRRGQRWKLTITKDKKRSEYLKLS